MPRLGGRHCVPVPGLRADRAVTFVCAQAQIDVRLKSNRAAMAATAEGFDHHALHEVVDEKVYTLSPRRRAAGGAPRRFGPVAVRARSRSPPMYSRAPKRRALARYRTSDSAPAAVDE